LWSQRAFGRRLLDQAKMRPGMGQARRRYVEERLDMGGTRSRSAKSVLDG
jgi:hypothetical protein